MSDAIAYQITQLHDDVTDMKSALKELATALTRFAVVEERQAQTAIALERAFKTLEKIEARVATQEGVSSVVGNSLQIHVTMIKDIQLKMDRHLEAFDTFETHQQGLVNKGLGAWKILAWVLAIAQSAVVAVAINLRVDLSDIHLAIDNLRQSDIRIIERMNSESGKK